MTKALLVRKNILGVRFNSSGTPFFLGVVGGGYKKCILLNIKNTKIRTSELIFKLNINYQMTPYRRQNHYKDDLKTHDPSPMVLYMLL